MLTAEGPLTRLTPGVLVAFDGIDGAGKTTQAERLVASLRALKLDAVRTKEPTSGPLGQRIRDAAKTHRLPPVEELDLFMRDRVEHVRNELEPWLAAGRIVVVDRYYFSTVAYQGARGMDPTRLLEMNEAIAPRPDLLFIMDIPAREGLTRVNRRGAADAFENELELDAARINFAALRGDYIHHLDGRRQIGDLSREILTAVSCGPLAARGATNIVEFVQMYVEALAIAENESIQPGDKAEALLRRIVAD